MRIAICGQTYYPGNNGQAIFTIHLAEGLARVGHDVAVIIPSEGFHVPSSPEMINGVQIYKIRSIPVEWIHSGTFITPFPFGQIQSVLKRFGQMWFIFKIITSCAGRLRKWPCGC